MKSYYRVMLGKGSAYIQECLDGSFIGADYGMTQDLTGQLPDVWRDFNQRFIPVYLENHPDKSKVAAGLACGSLWMVAKGIHRDDMVLCPDRGGRYHVGVLTDDYHYQPGGILPHRRPVKWSDKTIDRTEMSEPLRNAAGTPGLVVDINAYRQEIEHLIAGLPETKIMIGDETVENPSEFIMEKHLEEFLVANWSRTGLAQEFDIYTENGELVGQQYPTDTGRIDILAISKNKQKLLVLELKRGRASDAVVGQILRYMGYVKEVLAEPGQSVMGIIIAMDDDQRIRRALAMTPDIEFYRYQISFKLQKA